MSTRSMMRRVVCVSLVVVVLGAVMTAGVCAKEALTRVVDADGDGEVQDVEVEVDVGGDVRVGGDDVADWDGEEEDEDEEEEEYEAGRDERPRGSGHPHSTQARRRAEAARRASFRPGAARSGVFVETFQLGEDGDPSAWKKRWVRTKHTKTHPGVFSVDRGQEEPGIRGDVGLLVMSPATKHAIAAEFDKPLDPANGDVVVQYDLRLHRSLLCGGAYIKLLPVDKKRKVDDVDGDTRYTIMFGPDRCDKTDKVHFIFQHKHMRTGEFEEKHLRNPPFIKNDLVSHLYTLHLMQNNSFAVYIDMERKAHGTLLDSFSPPVNPPKMIDDPDDKMPDDWVTEARIPDPTAEKPDDWDEDEPLMIPDESAVKPRDWLDDEPLEVPDEAAQMPDDWDEELDGEYEAPMKPNPRCEVVSGCGPWVRPLKRNPKYKGPWRAPTIANPDYKGEWKPRRIPNPEYVEDKDPFHRLEPMSAVAVEIWTMQNLIQFDNFYVGHSLEDAFEFANRTWAPKFAREKELTKAPEKPKHLFGRLYDFVFGRHPLIGALAVGSVLFMTWFIINECCCSHDHGHEHGASRRRRSKPKKQVGAEAIAMKPATAEEEESDDDEEEEERKRE